MAVITPCPSQLPPTKRRSSQYMIWGRPGATWGLSCARVEHVQAEFKQPGLSRPMPWYIRLGRPPEGIELYSA